MAKVIFLSLKSWQNIMYTYVRVYLVSSAYVKKHVLQEGEDDHGNQKHIDFCSSHDIRALGIL